MPTPRQYATNAARQAAYRARHTATAHSAAASAPPPVPGYRRWAALISQAQELLECVTADMAAYSAVRSEAWQNSDRGDLFAERLAALEEIRDLLTDQAAGG